MAKKILIVDDDRSVLYILNELFMGEGYEVTLAENGTEALEKVEQNKPDLIILDIMMPKFDGTYIMLHLRENPQTASIPIIVISAYAQIQHLLTPKSGLEATAFIVKPFALSTLKSKVKEILPDE